LRPIPPRGFRGNDERQKHNKKRRAPPKENSNKRGYSQNMMMKNRKIGKENMQPALINMARRNNKIRHRQARKEEEIGFGH
jgi:hypothetical protein